MKKLTVIILAVTLSSCIIQKQIKCVEQDQEEEQAEKAKKAVDKNSTT